jgi:hypothetical protein
MIEDIGVFIESDHRHRHDENYRTADNGNPPEFLFTFESDLCFRQIYAGFCGVYHCI